MHALATVQLSPRAATTEASPRRAAICSECGYPVCADLAACEYCEIPKLTGVMPKLGLLTAMLLFSLSFYYGLARIAIWAASL
jgi:hypothetical protein